MKTIILFFTVIFSTLCSAGELRSDGVVLLQPDFALQEKGVEVSDLANYIKDTEAVSADAVKPSEVPPSSGFLVLAVREGNLSNAWLDMSPALPAGIEKNLIHSVRMLKPFKVDKGTVIFALKISINGAPETEKNLPYPEVWRKTASALKGPIDVESLVKAVWP